MVPKLQISGSPPEILLLPSKRYLEKSGGISAVITSTLGDASGIPRIEPRVLLDILRAQDSPPQ